MRLFVMWRIPQENDEVCWSGQIVQRGSTYEIVPCLLSLEESNFRRALLNQIQPGCIVTVAKMDRQSVQFVEFDGSITIFDWEQLRQSSARCRIFDHWQHQAIKYLASSNLQRRKKIKDLILDVFPPNEWYDPRWAEILGESTVYYTFGVDDYKVLSKDDIPKGIQYAVASIRKRLEESEFIV